MEHLARQIHNQLLSAKNTLIISHQNPDGDTLGSACALLQYLKTRGKPVRAFCATPVKKQHYFLPRIEDFVFDWQNLADQIFDTVVVLDSGDLRYAGVAHHLQALNYQPTIINIDHHATNELYGHHNLVITTAAATAEVLHLFFKSNKISIDREMALALLTGLVTDTTHFSNPATSATALKAGSDLLAAGGNLRVIRQWLFQNKTIAGLQLWGRVLCRLETNSEYNIATSYITIRDGQELAVPDDEMEGLINFLSGVLDCPITLLLKEKEGGIIKGSFRARRDDIDVSALAQRWGGGGHKKAAGFTIKGRLMETSEGLKII